MPSLDIHHINVPVVLNGNEHIFIWANTNLTPGDTVVFKGDYHGVDHRVFAVEPGVTWDPGSHVATRDEVIPDQNWDGFGTIGDKIFLEDGPAIAIPASAFVGG